MFLLTEDLNTEPLGEREQKLEVEKKNKVVGLKVRCCVGAVFD
jgi:hypothetical protein